MDLIRPNIERFLSAINLEEPDRVPIWEPRIEGRILKYVLGREPSYIESRAVPIDDSERIDLRKWGPEILKRIDEINREMKRLSKGICWNLKSQDYVELCRRIGQDVITVPLSKPLRLDIRIEQLLRRLEKFPEIDEDVERIAISLEDSIVRDQKDLDKLTFPYSIEPQIQRIHDLIYASKGTGIGVAPAARSVLCNTYSIMGIANFSKRLYEDRELVEAVMDRYLECSVEIAKACSKLDIPFLYLDDDIADSHGTIIPPRLLEELWLPRTEEMLKPLKRAGIPIVWHCCGNLTQAIPLAIELGIKAIEPIQPNCNDIYALKKKYGEEIALMGNIDMAGVLAFGGPKNVVEDVKKHIENLAEGGGYIVASSHTFINEFPPENFKAMVEAVHTYGEYPIGS